MVFYFSATAPQFNPEEEKEERENLSVEEKIAIENEIRGELVFQLKETNEVVNRGTDLLLEAIEMIGDVQKRAYLEACEKVPDLVRQESDPVAFLRGSKFDAWVSYSPRLLPFATNAPLDAHNPCW